MHSKFLTKLDDSLDHNNIDAMAPAKKKDIAGYKAG
jgi:hypothetical protein